MDYHGNLASAIDPTGYKWRRGHSGGTPFFPVQDHREPVPAAPPVPTPVESPSFSTDMQVDNHHQIYYKVVDDHTGDVLLEIPAEALRRIGESLNVTEIGNPKVSSLDITS